MSPGTTERTSQQSNSAATIAVAQVARLSRMNLYKLEKRRNQDRQPPVINAADDEDASLAAKLALLEGADQNQIQNLYKLEKTANQDRQPPVINAAPAKVFPSDEEDRQVHGSTEA